METKINTKHKINIHHTFYKKKEENYKKFKSYIEFK